MIIPFKRPPISRSLFSAISFWQPSKACCKSLPKDAVCNEMSENYIKLYTATGAVDSAFFLSEGSVYFYASNVDKYAISGKNLIIGSTEIIMKHLLNIDTDRIETAVAEGGSAVKKISADKFIAGLRTYSFALNASMVLAKQVFLTNQILHKNMTELNGEEKKIRDNAVAYYNILARMQQEYEKRRIPWL